MRTAGKQASRQRTSQGKGPGVKRCRKALQLQLTKQGAEEEEETHQRASEQPESAGLTGHADDTGVYSERQGKSLEDAEQRSDRI